MAELFREAVGRKVVSRISAEEVGTVSHLVVDASRCRVSAIVVGRGRKARLVDWHKLRGFGPDAVIVDDESALREPAGEHEELAAGGGLELVGRRVLSDTGNHLGQVDDVAFDPSTGAVETLYLSTGERPCRGLLGLGSYAVVLEDAEGARSRL